MLRASVCTRESAWAALNTPSASVNPANPSGTITNAAKVLRLEGASAVYACATHAVFSPPAVERLSSGVFNEVIVTNTIPLPPHKCFPQLTVLSVANLLGENIWKIYNMTPGEHIVTHQ